MKSIVFTFLLMLLSIHAISQSRHFGPASQATWERINEINSSMDWAQRLAGLAAAHSLIVSDPVEDFVDVLNTDESTYQNLEDFFHSMETVKQGAIRDAIDRLLLQEELDNATLTSEERDFWEDLRSTLDLSGHSQGYSSGDPHLTTFDGYQYDLQTVGEYTLCRSVRCNFEVQVRQKKYSENVSINTAVAMNLHGQHISFYVTDAPENVQSGSLYINGKPYQMNKPYTVFRTGGAIKKINDHYYIVIWETGEKVSISMHRSIDMVVTVPTNKYTLMQGLMGNNNKNKTDELKTADGRLIEPKNWNKDLPPVINSRIHADQNLINAEKAYNESLANQFSNSWRVVNEKSLFTYPAGYTTETFTDRNFPSSYNSISKLSPDQIAAARRTCQKKGVPEAHIESCIYDLAFTGEEIFTSSGIFLAETGDLLAKWGIQTTLKEKSEILTDPKKKVKSEVRKKLRF